MSLTDSLFLDPYPFEVWIAFRNDGIKGSGTLNDPYDGSSTARFDGIMNLLGSSPILIHLGPGPFTTAGYGDSNPTAGWQIKAGMKIAGAGMGETTLKLDNPSGSNVQFFAIGHRLNDGAATLSPTPAVLAEVCDLTIDCNLPNSGTVACGAIRLMGDHVRIRNVRAIRWGTRSATQPCFVFSLVTGDRSAGVAEPINAGMEGCVAELPSANSSGAISVFHMGGSGYSAAVGEAFGKVPFIRNCFVDGGSTSPVANIRGVSVSWSKGAVIEGNQLHNIEIGGPYIENATSRDMIIRGNTYKNVARGPYWKLGALSSGTGGSGTLARSGTVATVTMASVHNLATGDRVKIDSTTDSFDGVYLVQVAGENVFKVAVPDSGPTSATISSVNKLFGIANLLVEKNLIELAIGSSGVIAIHVDDGKSDGNTAKDLPDYDCLEAIIRMNRIRYVDGQFASNYAGTGIKVAGVKNVIVQDNVLESAPANPIRHLRCGTVKYFNNKTPDGMLIQGVNGVTLGKYTELETDAEDVFVLGLLGR